MAPNVSTRSKLNQREKEVADAENIEDGRETSLGLHPEGSHHTRQVPLRPIVEGDVPTNLDLTGFTPNQITFLLNIARNMHVDEPQKNKERQHDDEAHSSVSGIGKRRRHQKSVFSRLGSSQNTDNPRHEKPHHAPEVWKENRRRRELRKEIDAKKVAYAKEKKRLEDEYEQEKEKSPEPTPEGGGGGLGSSQQELLHTIMELKRKVEGEIPATLGTSLFTRRLEEESKQRHLKHPNLDSYNGSGDPDEHLSYFEQISLFYEYKDLTSCRFFASTLRGNAQKWFCRITPRTINTWAEFKKAFLDKFKANQPHEVHTVYLETIAQKTGESLESYLDRFKEAVNKVVSVNETEALVHLRRGLNPYDCERYICKLMEEKPTSLARAYELASIFITETEAMKVLKQTRNPAHEAGQRKPYFQKERFTFQNHQVPAYEPLQVQTTHGPASTTQKRSFDKTRSLTPQAGRYPDRRPEPTYTALSMPRINILREIRNKPFYQKPPALWTAPANRDSTKYCEYHETHGHVTEDCKSLKRFLEGLIKQGHLNQYLPRQIASGNNNASTSQQGVQGKNIVNVVIGGNQSPPRGQAGEQVMALDHTEMPHEPITFSEADFEGINPDNTEALVISIEIKENIVKKVLIDNGSSVDVIFTHCWERLKLEGSILEKCPEEAPLYGFGHSDVPVTGIVRLPILFGTAPKQVHHFIKLYVVNTPSSYNMILGRPTLTRLRAITSTAHLKMKFPTMAGTGEIKGDTEASKYCYGSALNLAQTDPSNMRRARTAERKREKRKRHLDH